MTANTKIGLITTTVNVPRVLERHVANVPPNCTLDVVVAGDVQTPPETRDFVRDLGGTYLGVSDELTLRWHSEMLIGTRSIQRRNLALLHAITLGCDVIVTIDDDNHPLDSGYLDDFIAGFTADVEYLTSTNTGWYNPGNLLYPRVTHRGFPLGRRHDDVTVTHNEAVDYVGDVGVVAGLCIGNPDVDALERIVNNPRVTDIQRVTPGMTHGVVLASETWAPFNTQNTAYSWDVAPLMQCLVGVGRYDDIWMSYVARRVMDDFGYSVRYALPIAVQERNVHNLVTDLLAELHGYQYTESFAEALRCTVTPDKGETIVDFLERVYDGVRDELPDRTNRANSAWISDVRSAVAEGTRVRDQRIIGALKTSVNEVTL